MAMAKTRVMCEFMIGMEPAAGYSEGRTLMVSARRTIAVMLLAFHLMALLCQWVLLKVALGKVWVTLMFTAGISYPSAGYSVGNLSMARQLAIVVVGLCRCLMMVQLLRLGPLVVSKMPEA